MRARFPNADTLPALGDELLDQEHRTVAYHLGKLQIAIAERAPVSEQRLILHEAVAYLTVHCVREEEWMRQDAYPDLQWHVAAHKSLYDRMEWMDEILIASGGTGALDALAEITMDLYNHVTWDDRRILEWHRAQTQS